MARISKYEMLVGKVVNGIYVSDYRRLQKISKTGRKYYRYEVQVDNVLWISTTSWNKQTFKKRLNKLNGKTTNRKQTPVKQMYEVILSSIQYTQASTNTDNEDVNIIKTIYNLKELKATYKKLSKKLHPDMGGNEELFKQANTMYRLRKEAITSTLKHTDINDVHYKELVDLEEEIIEYADSIGTYRY